VADEIIKYELNVSDFTELKVINGVNVDYYSNPDSVGMAVFDATKKQASAILFSNKKGALSIELNDDLTADEAIPTVRVYSRFLSKVENSSDSTVRVMSVAPTARLQAKVIGNGRVVVHDIDANEVEGAIATGNGALVLDGKCQDATLSIVGTGSIQADGLSAVNVKCRNTGTGTIGCYAEKLLTVKGAGSGKIYYKGKPEVKKPMALGLKVEALAE
jgi:hypothetical protein